MFTFYQNFNARREEAELQREAESTGHDRFCQQRPGVTTRRKRRNVPNRRTHSAIEIECNNDAFASVRSVLLRKEKSASIEEDDSCLCNYDDEQQQQQPQQQQQRMPDEEGKGYYQLTSKIDSLAKILFNRVYAVKGYKEQDSVSQRRRYTSHENLATEDLYSVSAPSITHDDLTRLGDIKRNERNYPLSEERRDCISSSRGIRAQQSGSFNGISQFWRRIFYSYGSGSSGPLSSHFVDHVDAATTGLELKEFNSAGVKVLTCAESRNNQRQQYTALEQSSQSFNTYSIASDHHQASTSSNKRATSPTSSSSSATKCMSNEMTTASSSSAAVAGGGESLEMERRSRDRALSICRCFTRLTTRYSLLKHLNNIGSRVDKHWFMVRDNQLKTDRLLTLAPLNRNCCLSISASTRDVLDKLFLTLQHPYICPILDLDFIQHENLDYVVLVQPINQGSLKDLIYGIERNCWNEDFPRKYGSRGKSLQITQIQRMGRQVLEALVFLKERDFPTVAHLHSGNVIVQNGVARLAALENTLLGFTSRIHPVIASNLPCKMNQLVPENIDVVSFGHMLFEMTAGYELCTFEPTAANYADIQKYPQILDCLKIIFERQTPGSKYPSIEELILYDLFRNIDLREMRSASVNIFRPDLSIPISKILEGIKCQKTPTKRSSEADAEDMISLSSPENSQKEDLVLPNSDKVSSLVQVYEELSITSV